MNRRELFNILAAPALAPAIDSIQSVERIDAKPDDVLVVKVRGHISHENAEHLRSLFQRALPGREILIIDDQIELQFIPGDKKP